MIRQALIAVGLAWAGLCWVGELIGGNERRYLATAAMAVMGLFVYWLISNGEFVFAAVLVAVGMLPATVFYRDY